MSRACTICTHPDHDLIDQAITSGVSNRSIASRWALCETSIRRHKKNHTTAAMAKAIEIREVSKADSLLSQVRHLNDRAMNILSTAESTGDLRAANGAIREARGCCELLARVAGELETGGNSVNILIQQNPEWITIRTAILKALEPHPEARASVIKALEGSTNV